MLPIYASLARPIFAQNCTVVFNESRWFRISDHFLPTDRIPRSRHVNCILRALTLRPSVEAARQIAAVLEPRHVTACALADTCCNRTQHKLVGLYIRTGWADMRLKASGYTCAVKLDAQSADAIRDSFFSLLMPPNFAHSSAWPQEDIPYPHHNMTATGRRGSSPLMRLPTLRSLVKHVVRRSRQAYSRNLNWSLFVASDSPAVRATAERYARELGVSSARTFGTVGHNNLPQETDRRGEQARKETRNAASTAVADLFLLSQADAVFAVHLGSSFPSTARRMAPCSQARETLLLHTRKFYSNLLVGSLFPNRNSQKEEGLTPVECLQDCFGLDLKADGLMQPWQSVETPLIEYADPPRNLSLSCRHSCSCWLQAALADGAEANLVR